MIVVQGRLSSNNKWEQRVSQNMVLVQFLAKFGGILTLMLSTFVLGVAAVVAIRYIGNFPSELDRIGSDLSLYGYGITLSLIFGYEAGRPVLKFFDSRMVPLAMAAAGILTLIAYGLTMFISEKIRKLEIEGVADGKGCPGGLSTIDELLVVTKHKQGVKLFKGSIIVGLLPCITVVLLDLLG